MRSLSLLVGLSVVAAAVAHGQVPTHVLHSSSTFPTENGHFGVAVAGVPDADGDGRGDLLVGADNESVQLILFAGRVHLYSGATGAVLLDLPSPNAEALGNFGTSVAGVPDTDGDGRGDLLVGAPYEDGGAENAGRAYLFSGANGALRLTLVSPAAEPAGLFGYAVAGVPDADGDGLGDLLVGAVAENGAVDRIGRAYLFSGATGVLLRSINTPSPRQNGGFGVAVAGVPDADGDGLGDLLVGAIGEDGGAPVAGRAYLVSGGTGVPLRTLLSPTPRAFGGFGVAVTGVPDLDGDGRGDLLVGAEGEDGGLPGEGHAHVFSGATGALLRTLSSPQPEGTGRFGAAVGSVPDIDGDGRPDLLVGAPRENGGAPNAGRAYLFSGATGALARTMRSAQAEANGLFGFAVAGVPSGSGDGRGAMLIGAFLEDDRSSDDGRAYLFEPAPVAAETAPPGRASLDAYPNPSSGTGRLSYDLADAADVRLVLLDALGREVAVVADGAQAAGRHSVSVDLRPLAPGVYLARLTSGSTVRARRWTLLPSRR